MKTSPTPTPPPKLAALADTLGIRLAQRIDPRRSKQQVWYVAGHRAGPAALKWYSDRPRPTEAIQMATWSQQGLMVPAVLDHGHEPSAYMLTRFLDADPMPARAAATWFPHAMATLRDLHDVEMNGVLPATTPSNDHIVLRSARLLERAGFNPPDPAAMYRAIPPSDLVAAHGQFKPSNVLPVDGELYVVGASGKLAPAARDAGWWALHACADPADLLELDRWTRQAATLVGTDRDATLGWAAVALIVLAADGLTAERAEHDEVAALVATTRNVLSL